MDRIARHKNIAPKKKEKRHTMKQEVEMEAIVEVYFVVEWTVASSAMEVRYSEYSAVDS